MTNFADIMTEVKKRLIMYDLLIESSQASKTKNTVRIIMNCGAVTKKKSGDSEKLVVFSFFI